MVRAQRLRERARAWPTIGTLVSLICFLALASPAEAFIYWTNGDSIGRADLDGTGVRSRFIPISTHGLSDLALDADYAYWATCKTGEPCTDGAIGRANLDGMGIDESLIGGIDPTGVAVDSEHIYWTWSECGAECSTAELQTAAGGIGRANLDGTGVDESFIDGINPAGVGAPSGYVAVDAERIYWTGSFCEGDCNGQGTDQIAFAVGRANLDGTGVDRDFIITGRSPGGGVAGTDLALDAGHIYWSGRDFTACCGATIGRANLDGTGVEQHFIAGPCCLYAPLWRGIAVDSARVYWTQYDSRDTPTGSILHANLDGTGVEPAFIAPLGDESISPSAIAVDAPTVTKAEGKASAAKTQTQGKAIVVKVRIEAKERLTAEARGQITFNATYKLKPKAVDVARSDTKKLRLKPRKAKSKRILHALKHGEKARAKLMVKLTDQAGNTKTEKLQVTLLKAQTRSNGR
jgi:virginiamycin B lyase